MTVKAVNKAPARGCQAAAIAAVNARVGSVCAPKGIKHVLLKALSFLEVCFLLAVTIVIAVLFIRFSIHWLHPFSI